MVNTDVQDQLAEHTVAQDASEQFVGPTALVKAFVVRLSPHVHLGFWNDVFAIEEKGVDDVASAPSCRPVLPQKVLCGVSPLRRQQLHTEEQIKRPPECGGVVLLV